MVKQDITVPQAYRAVRDILAQASIDNAAFEARQLCMKVLGMELAVFLASNRLLTEAQRDTLFTLAQKRATHYPLQYLLGEWEFYGFPFEVGEGVLIPRQDTECLCDTALRLAKEKALPTPLTMLDLCSGSGCIGITLSKLLEGKVYLLEKSPDALVYLKRNIMRNQSDAVVLHDDALHPIKAPQSLSMILCNPPYLTDQDMGSLQPEVTHEPAMALWGQADGLHFYREITKVWKSKLAEGGYLLYEVGKGQEEDVALILTQNGFKNVCFQKDTCGIIRCVFAQKIQNNLD